MKKNVTNVRFTRLKWLNTVVLLHPLDIPNEKQESISMNSIVSLLCTEQGHDAI